MSAGGFALDAAEGIRTEEGLLTEDLRDVVAARFSPARHRVSTGGTMVVVNTAVRPPGAVLEAVLERLTYVNEETGYTVARVATDRSSDLLTVVGALLGAQPGESLRLVGRWSSHPQYGRQFEVESYTTVLPATIQVDDDEVLYSTVYEAAPDDAPQLRLALLLVTLLLVREAGALQPVPTSVLNCATAE